MRVAPVQRVEHGGDDLGFGLRLIQKRGGITPRKNGLQVFSEGSQALLIQRGPCRGFAHAAQKKILGK